MSAYADLFETGPLPATEKQIGFARSIAARTGAKLGPEVMTDRSKLSAWINVHKSHQSSQFAAYPSSKQVAFAERVARLKRREIPTECFRDRRMMSRWIDSNKP